MKLELLTNATVVDDAIKFVASHSEAPIYKASFDKTVVVNKVDHIHENQESIATTNIVF